MAGEHDRHHHVRGLAVPQDIAAEAARIGAPIAVGVTEDTADRERFINAQIVVAPNGDIVDRYEKVRRVPFGEYVPLRGVLEALGAPVDQIGRATRSPARVPPSSNCPTARSWRW